MLELEQLLVPELVAVAQREQLREDGELGELVFTSLTKEAFPIIRYRTRDLTRLLPGTARSTRRLAKGAAVGAGAYVGYKVETTFPLRILYLPNSCHCSIDLRTKCR